MDQTKPRRAAMKRRLDENDNEPRKASRKKMASLQSPISADELHQRLLRSKSGASTECTLTYLTENKSSWILHCPRWHPCPAPHAFEEEWMLHPSDRHLLKLFGRVVAEKRWSQSWGMSYSYSGATNPGRDIPPQSRLAEWLRQINTLMKQEDSISDATTSSTTPASSNVDEPEYCYYNACLQNWYEPDDTIGRHADDERDLLPTWPIFSLSWGGTRRFVLRSKAETTQKTEVWLKDGDLLVMGGRTQETHFHEVPKRRVTMDPPTGRRINWTIRAFQTRE